MKIKFQITLYIVTSLLIASCKDKRVKVINNKVETVIKKDAVDDPYFYVTLRAKFTENDMLDMYYLSGHLDNYSAENKITTKVTSNEDFQDVRFELKEEVYPYNIRLDLGTNKEQSSILIKECILHYGNEIFKIEGKDMIKFFHFNKGVELSSDSLTFILKTYKHKEKNFYDPFLMGNEELSNILGTEL